VPQAGTSPVFGILSPTAGVFTTLDMVPLQSTRHWGSLTRPIRRAESPRAIRFAIQCLVVVPQAGTSPIFGILNSAVGGFPTLDMVPLQSTRHWGLRTRPIRCAKSPRAIRFAIQSLVVVLQAGTSPIFGILNPAAGVFPTLDMVPLQSTRHWGLCTRSIQRAESPRAIHSTIQCLLVGLQAGTSPIVGILNPAAGVFTTLDMVPLQSTRHWE